jgi:hypothetical protein
MNIEDQEMMNLADQIENLFQLKIQLQFDLQDSSSLDLQYSS